jgi:integrase
MGLYRRKWKDKNGTVHSSKTWWMDYVVPGEGQKCESTGTSNKRLARKILDKRKGEIAEGRFNLPKSNPPTLKQWAEQFLETIAHPNTKRVYASCIRVLSSFFGDARLSQISPGRIEEFKLSRTRAGAKHATINRNLAVLRRMMKLATRQRLVGRNPFEDVDFLEERSRRRQPHILTFEEQAKLEAEAPPLLRTLVVLLTETGLRVGREALPLKWIDVDLIDSVLFVRDTKTPAGIRPIPLSKFCTAILGEWRRLTGPEFSPYVFANPNNPQAHLKSVRKTWKRALTSAQITYFWTYDLRATFASRLAAAGVPDVFISQMMGHAGGLLQTYAKAIVEYRRDAIRKLEAFRESSNLMITEGLPNKDLVQ